MRQLREKIMNRESGILLYGLTPPKKDTSEEKRVSISEKQVAYISQLGIDGLVLYDIDEEADRISDARPFPFKETLDPVIYSEAYLKDLEVPRIVYRCVSKYSDLDIKTWINSDDRVDDFTVFVGASAKHQRVKMRLKDAYNLNESIQSNILLGGVAIPERHITKHNEHLRCLRKIESGCQYFITQAVYNLEATKNFLSDYYVYCTKNSIEMVPIIVTLSPCGSQKTLDFMKWLGISVSKWLENELTFSDDILNQSVEEITKIFAEIVEFANNKGIPIGCNVESLSARKSEIDAAIELIANVKQIMK